jgi:hypothetical protein
LTTGTGASGAATGASQLRGRSVTSVSTPDSSSHDKAARACAGEIMAPQRDGSTIMRRYDAASGPLVKGAGPAYLAKHGKAAICRGQVIEKAIA